ncbi:MAG TPA: HAMP domain-containing sensor histidine kinase [Pseudonocardiaceae bacterium]|jgi:two-component system OmpR family sensor kinase|nr:HAMP domain-containing sensor histidine kinase [Pseudonocardiaceae bacterium]
MTRTENAENAENSEQAEHPEPAEWAKQPEQDSWSEGAAATGDEAIRTEPIPTELISASAGPTGPIPAGAAPPHPVGVPVPPRRHRVRPFHALGSAFGRLPLRVHLVVALVVLLAAGLFGTWWAASAEMQYYLVGQVDKRLERAGGVFDHFTFGGVPDPRRLRAAAPPGGGYVVQVTIAGQTTTYNGSGIAAADLPAIPATLKSNAPPATEPSLSGNGSQWRVLARSYPQQQAEVVVAANLDDVDTAIGDLTQRFLWIALAGLVLIGGLGYALVRGSLRPLEEVEGTAEAIAAGDLSRRVPVRRPGSEVGRLANAFNTMVGRIENAFRASERSEASARGSEERMRQFVADASHELRTPLTSIRGYAELYRQGAVASPEEVAGVLRRIEDQAARMGLLVDDLLLLARLDHQRPLERTPVDLTVLAVDAVHDAHAVAPDRAVGLRLPPARGEEPVAVPVLGDTPRLRQVIGNLLNNAITHTPPDTRIELRVRTDGADAVLEVADAGPGLPPEQARRVFERFYRADPSRGRDSGGSGLGLAIVAALVAAHGGRVEVDTAVGVGTTFRVLLPLAN